MDGRSGGRVLQRFRLSFFSESLTLRLAGNPERPRGEDALRPCAVPHRDLPERRRSGGIVRSGRDKHHRAEAEDENRDRDHRPKPGIVVMRVHLDPLLFCEQF